MISINGKASKEDTMSCKQTKLTSYRTTPQYKYVYQIPCNYE